MDTLFILVSIPTLGIGLTWFCIAVYVRVRRKGYSPPGATFALLAGASASTICIYFDLLKSAFSQWSAALWFAVMIWLPTLAYVATTALIVLVLPRRNPRMSGKRRTRPLLITTGFGLFGLGIVFVVLALWMGFGFGDAVKVFGILAGFSAVLIGLGKRAQSTVSIEEATGTERRGPVLYLRAFRQEHFVFISGPTSRYGQYISAEGVALLNLNRDEENTDPEVEVRFEQYFRKVLNDRIGPFVALGNPEDYVPPEGAARTYASDSDWMQHVEKLITECSCIVAEISMSSNLAWELKYLLERGLQQKLFIMTRPVPIKSTWFSRFFFRTLQIQVITWNDFARTMNEAGYEVGSEPGPGSVLTFDAAGKLVVLRKGALTPEEFVEPIREHLLANLGYSTEALDPALPAVPAEPAATATKVVKPPRKWSWIKKVIYVVAFFAACFLVPKAWEVVEQYRERLRAEALQSFASQMKLKFTPGALKVNDPDLSKTLLIDQGAANGIALYALEGEVDGLGVLLFDYQYEVTYIDRKDNSETRKDVQSVAAFCCAEPGLPLFELWRYSFMNLMSVTTDESAKHIEFDRNPEFSKRFMLFSGDKPSINRLFSLHLRSFLNDRYPKGNWRVEGTGRWLMLYRERVRIPTEEWKSFFDQTSQFARGFFQNMGKDPAP